MSKLKLMDYEVVSEMISIGVTPEEYLPRIRSLTAPALLIRELMYIGVESNFAIEDDESFVLRCPEYSEHYNDVLEEFIQSFRYKSRRVQSIIEAYRVLRDRKAVPLSLIDQSIDLQKEIDKLREEAEEEQEAFTKYKSEVSDSLYSLQEELKEATRTLDCMIDDLTESD